MAIRAALLALVAVMSFACDSAQNGVRPSASQRVHLGSLGSPRCAPGAAFAPGGLQETGVDTSKGSFWALVFGPLPPPAGKDVKIVWRMTGTGDFSLRAIDAGGTVIPTLGEPQPHGVNGSTWNHPGYEVGTGFNFPHSGCWDIHVARSDVEGDLWLEVASPQ